MPTELKLPEVGDNIEQGTVVTVLVKPGDAVSEGQAIIEIETDKAVVEVPASAAGTVESVLVKEGDSVPIGGTILTLGGAEAQPKPDRPEPAQPAPSEPDQPEPAPKAQTQPAQATAPARAAPPAPRQVTLPEVGDNIEQGAVVSVLVKPGDQVAEGQPVIELETDKAVVEVPANAAGTVKEVLVKEGDNLPVGGAILTLEGGAEQGAPSQPADDGAETEEAVTVAPEPKVAERVQAEQMAAQDTEAAPPASAPAAPPQTFDGRPVIHAAPSVRRLARELNVDIARVAGSGPAGRVSEQDVRQFAEGTGAEATPAPQAPAQTPPPQSQAQSQAQAPSPAPSAPSALPDFSRWGQTRAEDMSGIRRATVRSMTQAWTTIPMVTQFDKADVTRMEEARGQFAARVERAGGKLTLTSILMKVVAGAVRRFPKFGASLDLANTQVIYKEYVNLGVAVDTPNGLLVPVIKDADRKSITELSIEIGELAAKARDRKLRPDEMQGATFTISNLGGIGGYAFTPIVNPPEVAILGVSRGGLEPVWNKELGAFEPRNLLPLTLSYDHRLIDGADAARFVRFVCESLEDPFLISL